MPSLRVVNEAIRRRLRAIPFLNRVPDGARDTKLDAKLRREYPGILRQVIDGGLDYQRNGLRPPSSVTNATANYLESQDTVTAWLEEACDIGPEYTAAGDALFASWRSWADKRNLAVGTWNELRATLESRRFQHTQRAGNSGTQRGFKGLRPKPHTETNAWHQR
jgi:putative DNA primase/helicase